MSRNLVIVRAGNTSLHQAWLGNPDERNWDIIINYYGDDPNAFRDAGTVRVDSKGPKWPALHDTLIGLGDTLERYDYVWLPDDDLASDVASINKFFAICSELALNLAQPSLTLDSYLSHPMTLKNKAFQVRFTNFVEIMAPCFSKSFLQRCLPSFAANLSGWGLDFLWPSWIDDPTKIAIIDAVSVRHTRPVGGPNYKALKERGVTPDEEMRSLLSREGISVIPTLMTRGGLDIEGHLHATWKGGHRDLIKFLMRGYLPEWSQHSDVLFSMIAPILDDAVRNPAVSNIAA